MPRTNEQLQERYRQIHEAVLGGGLTKAVMATLQSEEERIVDELRRRGLRPYGETA